MDPTVDDAPRRETGAAAPGTKQVSRRRFLGLGTAWTIGLVAFAAAACGGEEDDDGDEEEDE